MHIFVSLTRQQGKRGMEELHPDLLHHFLGGADAHVFQKKFRSWRWLTQFGKGTPSKLIQPVSKWADLA